MGVVPASSEAALQAGGPPLPCHPLSGGVARGEPILEDWKQCSMGGEHRTHEAGTFGSRVSTRNLPEMGQMQECN